MIRSVEPNGANLSFTFIQGGVSRAQKEWLAVTGLYLSGSKPENATPVNPAIS